MADSIIGANGRTTVPKVIRDALHMETGIRLSWTLATDGTVLVRIGERKNAQKFQYPGTFIQDVPEADRQKQEEVRDGLQGQTS